MLKRNGKYVSYSAPASQFAPGEAEAYHAAFQAIESDFKELTQMQAQLDHLHHSDRQLDAAFPKEIRLGGQLWQVKAKLLQLPQSEVFLCSQSGQNAVVQRFPVGSPYGQAQGGGEVLMTGNNIPQLVGEYLDQAQHTLRFMASHLVAKAQKIVWEQYPQHNPSKVAHALSLRCGEAVGVKEGQSQPITQTPKPARGIRL